MNLTNPISVICLQECWLSAMDNVTMFNLDGYELFSQPNQCCAHGGLIIYVRRVSRGGPKGPGPPPPPRN